MLFYYTFFDIISLVPGGVAQGLEQAAHNRLVVGSNPTAPTRFYLSRHFGRFFSGNYVFYYKKQSYAP